MDQREAILAQLSEGKSLSEICRQEGMPERKTVQRWQAEDPEFDVAVTRAREEGFELRAVEAVREAKLAKDASLGRLAFDAERWFLGKLSNAFSDKSKHELTGKDGGPIAYEAVRSEVIVVDPQSPDQDAA